MRKRIRTSLSLHHDHKAPHLFKILQSSPCTEENSRSGIRIYFLLRTFEYVITQETGYDWKEN